MRRFHAIEIHEQPWCPVVIRSGVLDCLRFIEAATGQYDGTVALLTEAYVQSGATRFLDLCSGSGGPWEKIKPQVWARLQSKPPILLSDLYPPPEGEGAPQGLDFHPRPVDARRPPVELRGFRTLFTSLHHFKPRGAQEIMQSAVNNGEGIAILEQTSRTLPALLVMLLLPFLALLSAPWLRPFSWKRLLLTFPLPVIPLVLCFDGVISCFRSYTLRELQRFTSSLQYASATKPYIWKIGTIPTKFSPIGVTYVIGYPRVDRIR